MPSYSAHPTFVKGSKVSDEQTQKATHGTLRGVRALRLLAMIANSCQRLKCHGDGGALTDDVICLGIEKDTRLTADRHVAPPSPMCACA